MDLLELLKSVVIAAVITGTVALIGFFASSTTAKKVNEDKLKIDKELVELKIAAERELAEKRVELEKHLSLSKRKAEVAEKVLSEFYRAKRAFEAIRSPMIWAAEMQPEDGVAEDIVNNDGYGVIRRVRKYEVFFAELDATRFTYGALFGRDATAPYDEITRAFNKVVHGARALLQYRNQLDQQSLQGHIAAMRANAFSGSTLDAEGNEVPDQLSAAIDNAIARIEVDCRPALESIIAAEAAGRE